MISVIICSYNRADSLRQTLESLQAMSAHTPVPWELIVVDNNSTDHTKRVVAEFSRATCVPLKYVFEAEQGLSPARNRGIREAQGEILAFTDDDVVVDEHWLSTMWNVYQHHDIDALGGRVLPLYLVAPPQWVKENEHFLRGPLVIWDYGEDMRPVSPSDMGMIVGANMSFKRTCFETYGVFLAELGPRNGVGGGGDDQEFVERLIREHRKVYYNGQMRVWHKIPKERMTYQYLAKWYFSSGRCMVQLYDPIPGNAQAIGGFPTCQIKAFIRYAVLCLRYVFDRQKTLEYLQLICQSLGMGYEFKRRRTGQHA